MNAIDILWHAECRRYRLHRRLRWAAILSVGAAILFCILVHLGMIATFPEWFR